MAGAVTAGEIKNIETITITQTHKDLFTPFSIAKCPYNDVDPIMARRERRNRRK